MDIRIMYFWVRQLLLVHLGQRLTGSRTPQQLSLDGLGVCDGMMDCPVRDDEGKKEKRKETPYPQA